MTGPRRDGSGGFSLVEVLVALAVTGMVVLGAGSLTALIRDAEGRFDQDAAARDQIIAAHRVLRDLVAGAVPSLEGAEGAFGARENRLTLKTTGSAIMALDRPSPVTLAVRDRQKDLKALIVVWRDPGADAEREEVVIDGARVIAFACLGAAPGQIAAWRPDWTHSLQLPRAVSLRVDFPSLGPPIDLVARTFSKFPQVCIALPHEPDCRHGASSGQSARR